MPDHRIPKSALFGWLTWPRPRGGSRKRWRDVIRKDLKDIEVDEDEWYSQVKTRMEAMCRLGMENYRLQCRLHGWWTEMWCVKSVVGPSGERVTRRDTSAGVRGRNQCGNRLEPSSA